MSLRDELARDGNWLFRRRSEFPLIVLALVLLELYLEPYAYRNEQSAQLWAFMCLAVALLGEAVRIYTVGYAPGGTSARGTSKPTGKLLSSAGIYSVVRHPLYIGNLIIWLGLAAYARSWRVELITLLIFWVYYERVMFAEEEFLRSKFGDAFERWAATTPAFIPALRNWSRPALPFSWLTVVRREHSTLFAIVATLTLLVHARDLFYDGRARLHAFWLGLFVVSAVLFVSAALLTRRTAILTVEGR
jgi:protein-S-isoprenylcysteine O-methyltransferase Ste14